MAVDILKDLVVGDTENAKAETGEGGIFDAILSLLLWRGVNTAVDFDNGQRVLVVEVDDPAFDDDLPSPHLGTATALLAQHGPEFPFGDGHTLDERFRERSFGRGGLEKSRPHFGFAHPAPVFRLTRSRFPAERFRSSGDSNRYALRNAHEKRTLFRKGCQAKNEESGLGVGLKRVYKTHYGNFSGCANRSGAYVMYKDGDDDPEFREEQATAYWEQEMIDLACLVTEAELLNRE